MTAEPLIAHRDPQARVATRAGVAISAARFVADASALAALLPPSRYLLNTCRDRYAFAVALGAAVIAGRTSLLPPSRAPEMLAQLAQRYPDLCYVGDSGGEVWCATSLLPAAQLPLDVSDATAWPPPLIAREHVAAIAFTSGSTGEPQAQTKTWGGVVDGARAEVNALQLHEAPIDNVVLVGTVSPQHMYGLESTVMMALHGPCAFAAEHPLHADEVSAVMSALDGRCVLITTPVHLRALVESSLPMPALDRVVSATAPLAPALAARCESNWNTRVFEVYGCTETGMVATRRTVEGPRWKAMRDVKIERRDERFFASGGHARAGQLADRLRLLNDTTFELVGRVDDVINVGGKRASLDGLNRLLLSLDGVLDGVIFFPAIVNHVDREQRLAAMVVAPGQTREQIVASLRTQFDAAFMPRPLWLVDRLPRNSQGKLPRAELLKLAKQLQRASNKSQPAVRDAVARTRA